MTLTVRTASACLFSALALAACASGARVAPPASAAPALATVSGTVRIYGGPLLPNGKMAANGNPMQAIAPVVVKEAGRIVPRGAATDAAGRYSLRLPAGTYSLSAGCSEPVTVVLRAGARVLRDLRCDVP